MDKELMLDRDNFSKLIIFAFFEEIKPQIS